MENTNVRATKMANLQEQFESLGKECVAAISKNDLIKYNEAKSKLDGSVKEYNGLLAYEVYDELLKTDSPVVEAVKRYEYEGLRVKEIRETETHIVTGVEIETKTHQINLLDFFKYSKIDNTFETDCQGFNQLLTLRCAKILGLSDTELKNISKTYYMSKIVTSIELGKTPTSNTQVCKKLQEVIDCVLPTDKDGKSIYKCNSHDVAYLDACYAKRGKASLSVAMAKHDFLRRLVTDIMHRIVCGETYSVEYKRNNN